MGAALRDNLYPVNETYHGRGRIGVTIYEREPLVRHGLRSIVGDFDQTYVLREVDEPAASVVSPPNGDRQVNLVGPSAATSLGTLARQTAVPSVALIHGTSYAEFNAVRSSGVRGLVLIDEVPNELEFAITAVAAGRSFLSGSFAGRILDWMSGPATGEWTLNTGPGADLTEREYEVLILLGRGWTNYEIARELRIQDTTVRTHLCHLLAKLNLRNRTAAVMYAIQSELYGCFLWMPDGREDQRESPGERLRDDETHPTTTLDSPIGLRHRGLAI